MVSRADRVVDLESVLAAEADFIDDPTDPVSYTHLTLPTNREV